MSFLGMAKVGLKTFGRFVKRNAPTILTIFGVGSAAGAVVYAVKDTPKAMRAIEEKKTREHKEKLTPLETVDVTWKYYIRTASLLVVAVACPIAANAMNLSTQAALVAACTTQANKLKSIEEKTKELLGDDNAKQIKREAAKEEAKQDTRLTNYVSSRNDMFPVKETWSGQVFESNKELLEMAVLKGKALVNEDWGGMTVNEWLQFLEDPRQTPTMKPHNMKDGDMWKWDERTKFGVDIELDEVEGTPCYILSYDHDPIIAE